MDTKELRNERTGKGLAFLKDPFGIDGEAQASKTFAAK
jgi:hypothetical protein